MGYLLKDLMITKKAKVKAPPADEPGAGPWLTPPTSEEERLQRIEAMGLKITKYVQFIRKVHGLCGTSVESRDRAVVAFYERMVVLERQLGRIQEELQLG